eukprot:COSAG02_NODE_88_length_38629_cov_457.967999_13_plen_48_part_00
MQPMTAISQLKHLLCNLRQLSRGAVHSKLALTGHLFLAQSLLLDVSR